MEWDQAGTTDVRAARARAARGVIHGRTAPVATGLPKTAATAATNGLAESATSRKATPAHLTDTGALVGSAGQDADVTSDVYVAIRDNGERPGSLDGRISAFPWAGCLGDG